MADKPIKLIIPDADEVPDADTPIKLALISPDGADPDREVPGFFILQIDGEYLWPGEGGKPPEQPGETPVMPRQFLTLRAVHDYLSETYGWTTPLRVTTYAQIERGGKRDFPAIWGAERRIGKRKAVVRARYIGSFRYWSGRLVDPTKVGTPEEFG